MFLFPRLVLIYKACNSIYKTNSWLITHLGSSFCPVGIVCFSIAAKAGFFQETNAMRTIIFFLIGMFIGVFLAFSPPVLGQEQDKKYILSGRVADSVTKAPLAGATVTVIAVNRKWTAIAGQGTGAFQIQLDHPEMYRLEISYIGYKKQVLDSLQFKKTNVLNAGTIYLAPQTKTQKEVVVVGKKPMLELQAGKSIYNVQQDPMATGKQLNEVLENLPGVSVNSNGIISVNGVGEIIVMINNKVSRMNYNDVLKQMPASAIERVELIQGASPRYAAMGAEYILNIITLRDAQKRRAGSLSASAATNSILNSLFMYSIGQRRAGYYTRINNSYNNLPHLREYSRQQLFTGRKFFSMDGYNTMKHAMHNFILGTDQYLDSSSILSLEYGLNLHRDQFRGNTLYTRYDTVQETSNSFGNQVQTNPREVENNFSMNYHRKLKAKSFLETELYYSIYNQRNNRNSPLAARSTASLFRSYNINFNGEWRTEKSSRLQYLGGLAYRRVSISNELKMFDTALYAIDRVKNYVDAMGLYASVTIGIGKGSLMMGLRAEQLNLGSYEKQRVERDTAYKLLSLYPSVFYKQPLGPAATLSLSFSRKVVYPEVHFVFNSPNQADDFDQWSGNSLLVPAIMSRAQADVVMRKKNNTYSLSGFYTHTSNTFGRIQSFENGVRIDRFMNIDTRRSYGLSATVNIKPVKWLNTRFNSSINMHHFTILKNQWIKFDDTYSISGAVTNLVTFSKKWSFEAAVRFMNLSRNIYEEAEAVTNVTTQLSFKPKGNDKIVMSLFGHDLLNQMRFQSTNFLASDVIQQSIERAKWTRYIRLNISYKFGGDMKARERKIQLEKVNYIQG